MRGTFSCVHVRWRDIANKYGFHTDQGTQFLSLAATLVHSKALGLHLSVAERLLQTWSNENFSNHIAFASLCRSHFVCLDTLTFPSYSRIKTSIFTTDIHKAETQPFAKPQPLHIHFYIDCFRKYGLAG